MKRKKILIIGGLTVTVVCILIMCCYIAVVVNASGRTYDSADDVPASEYGLLLATSPITPQGAHYSTPRFSTGG